MTTKKQIQVTLLVGLAIILFLGGIKAFQIWQAIANSSKFKPPPDTVTTVVASKQEWKRTVHAVGSLTAVQGAVLSSQEPGQVSEILFESGAIVEQGQLLVKLDTGVEEADLKAAIALNDQAQKAVARSKTLRGQDAVSQADLELDQSKALEASAKIEAAKAALQRKQIVAPFAGKTGVRQVNLGEYLMAGTPVVALFDLNALHVDFSLPQRYVSQLAVGLEVKIKANSETNDKSEYTAHITAIDPQIDPSTRNIKVRALLENVPESIRPGMFVQAKVQFSEVDHVIVVPTSSVNYAPYGDTLFVVEKMQDSEGQEYVGVRQQFVKLGESRGNLVAVLSGIKAGDEIVSAGAFRLRPGAAVNINNSAEFTPSTELNPNPSDS